MAEEYMQPLVQKLYDSTTRRIFKLALEKSYPINPNVGLFCFREAFRDCGFKIKGGRGNRGFRFVLDWEFTGRNHQLHAHLGFDEILGGRGNSPIGSLDSLKESIAGVYYRLDCSLKRGGFKQWLEFEDSTHPKVERAMSSGICDYFQRYQENMLLDTTGAAPGLEKPSLFFEVLKDFPLEVYMIAAINKAENSPIAEDLLNIDWIDLDTLYYYPSRFAMVKYFHGLYLHALSKLKGFPLNSGVREKDGLRELIKQGVYVFEEGRRIIWGTGS